MLLVDTLLQFAVIGIIGLGAYLLGRRQGHQPTHATAPQKMQRSGAESDNMSELPANRLAEALDPLEDFNDSVSWLPDAIIILDYDLNLVWGNSVAETWFEFSTSEHAHHHYSRLMLSEEIEQFILGRGYPESFECASPTNPEVVLILRFLPYKNRQYLLQARDITQIKALENIRRDFIANASHELRTPVSIIYGYLEMMSEKKRSGISPEWDKAVKQMHLQTHRIKQIIEDMSMLSRLENPDTSNLQDTLNMAELIESVSGYAKILSGKRSHAITAKVNSEYGLLGNRSEIESLLSNLVSNAIHYTPSEGRITIKWDVKSFAGMLSIADTGIGIAKEELPRITERFYRVHASRPRNRGGTGLGLAIVNHIVNRNDAKLRIKSVPKKGSVFTVIFPRSRTLQIKANTNLLFG